MTGKLAAQTVVELVVSADDTAASLRTGDVDVLASPRVVALCDQAAMEAIAGGLDAGQTSVGTRVERDPRGSGGRRLHGSSHRHPRAGGGRPHGSLRAHPVPSWFIWPLPRRQPLVADLPAADLPAADLPAADMPADGPAASVLVIEERQAADRRDGALAPRPLRWWLEIIIIAVFYALYSLVRDINGSNREEVTQATHNADRVIALERHLHIFREAAIQHRFVDHRIFMEIWDAYYGTVHFLAVVAVLLVLFFAFPGRYRLWRNILALTTALALLGFAFFPLLPPRLLGPPFHFLDTVDVIGGLWTFDNDTVSHVSNLYAAMPSLHTAWSTWCSLALYPLIRRRWLKHLLLLYPLATIFCIVITANHYFADAAGGVIVLGGSYLVARPVTPWTARMRRQWRSERLGHPRTTSEPGSLTL
ncbi:MAG: phosphatase PAP2 family protein [Actinomycetota bacterium]|nr:phosphatase PAP2 family protein [Actinomycetota bacterium]